MEKMFTGGKTGYALNLHEKIEHYSVSINHILASKVCLYIFLNTLALSVSQNICFFKNILCKYKEYAIELAVKKKLINNDIS